MKYLIKIDVESIRKNKNAGLTKTSINTCKTITFKAYTPLPKTLKENVNYVMNTASRASDGRTLITGTIINSPLGNSILDDLTIPKDNNFTLTVDYDYETHEHSPIPGDSYDYENKEVVCSCCNHTVKTKDLKSDYNEFSYSDCICPKCNEWDCVELEHETITSAINRIKKFTTISDN